MGTLGTVGSGGHRGWDRGPAQVVKEYLAHKYVLEGVMEVLNPHSSTLPVRPVLKPI